MQITLTKEQVKEAFGELRFMGADNCYRYDKDSKKKTEEVEALKLHLGSMCKFRPTGVNISFETV